MIFHENCLLADDSHEISYLIFFRKLGEMSQNLSSAAVVIGVLRVKLPPVMNLSSAFSSAYFLRKPLLQTIWTQIRLLPIESSLIWVLSVCFCDKI